MAAIVEGSCIGPYRVLRKLGEGGMGAVFEAVHVALGRHVAIKVLHPEHAVRPEVVDRFFNEARAASLIDHPGIVQVADYGHGEDGQAYIVMEFLRGDSLSKRLASRGALSLADAFNIVRQLAGVLAAAHERSIVHRDLKPDNIMLVPDPDMPSPERVKERVKLLDFGIAKLLEGREPGHVKTRTDLVMGTPTYMSPEQCRGASHVDTKSDVYSLGVILYEMLAGRPPFIGDGGGLLIGMHMFKQPPRLRDLVPQTPERVDLLLHRLLSKEKQNRPTMRELAAEIQSLTEASSRADWPSSRAPWFSPLLRMLRPTWRQNSTLGFSTGELGEESPRTPRSRRGGTRALLALGIVGALTGAGAVGRTLYTKKAPIPVPITAASVLKAADVGATALPLRKIEWHIATDPAGAVVRLKDSGASIGLTPLVHEQPAAQGRTTLVLQLDGYEKCEVTLERDANSQIDRRLTRLADKVVPTASKRAHLNNHQAQGSLKYSPTQRSEVRRAPARPSLSEIIEK